jgi:predicted ABC-type ATPase
MNEDKPSFKQEIARHFELSSLLSSLIKARVQFTAESVLSALPKDQQHLDSAKMGGYEAWVSILIDKLATEEIERMINCLDVGVDKGGRAD